MTEYAQFHRLILAYVLAAARLGGALAILPATSSSMITGVARSAATLAFATLVVPAIMGAMPSGVPSWPLMMLMAVKEAVVGFLLGFFAAIPFWIAENIGNLIDNQRGATMGEVYSPLSGAQVSSTGLFFTQVVSTLFFVGGAVFILLGALYRSYALWPVFTEGIRFDPATPLAILGAADAMLETTVIIAAPIVILMFLATVGLGLVNRTAPQLNVFFLSMPIKSALGVAMLVVYLPFILDMLMYTKDDAIVDPVMKIIN